MKLITKALAKKTPSLYSTENVSDPTAQFKLFTPSASFTWYVTEFDGKDRMFGLVDNGREKELGYFSLSELERVRGPWGLGVERDRSFTSRPLSEVTQVANLER
jgi:hypothetical protein